MPTCTPVYRLPYILGTDAPCEQSPTWCAFAETVEDNLDRLDGVVSRTATAIPIAKLSLSTPQAYTLTTSGNKIAFDVIDEDSDNMVNLITAPGEIRPQRPGVYSVRTYIELGTTGSTSNSFIFRQIALGPVDAASTILPPTGTNPILQFTDPNLANSMTYCLRSTWRVTLPDSRFYATITYGSFVGTPSASLTRAEMDVFWMGD